MEKVLRLVHGSIRVRPSLFVSGTRVRGKYWPSLEVDSNIGSSMIKAFPRWLHNGWGDKKQGRKEGKYWGRVKKMFGMERATSPWKSFSGIRFIIQRVRRNPARNLPVCRAVSTFRRYYVNIDYLNRAGTRSNKGRVIKFSRTKSYPSSFSSSNFIEFYPIYPRMTQFSRGKG